MSREIAELLQTLRGIESGEIWYHTAEFRVRAACGDAARMIEAANVLRLLDRMEERAREQRLEARFAAAEEQEIQISADRGPEKLRGCKMAFKRGFLAGVEAEREGNSSDGRSKRLTETENRKRSDNNGM